MIVFELLNNFAEDAIFLSGQDHELSAKVLCSLAQPGGKILNLEARIMIVLELLNNFAEDAIILSGQDPEISAKHKFYAHYRRLVAKS